MEKINIEVNGKIYTCRVACDEDSRGKGLQNIPKLPENEGMLFVFEEPQEVSFWMKDTHIPLDVVFIDEYWRVISIAEGEPLSEQGMEEKNVLYVLEVNPESGISKNDYVDLDEYEELEDEDDGDCIVVKIKISTNKMQVIDAEGETQAELDGGERIFSRKNTKTMIRLAKRAHDNQRDSDFKKLGSKVFDFLKIQNEKEDDYVEIPTKK